MELKGKIILDLGAVSGTSKAGNNWKKHEYVLETQETYPKKVHFDFFGDNADRYQLNVGDDVTLSFDIESREYNGRWYTSIRGWKAETAGPPCRREQTSLPRLSHPTAAQTAICRSDRRHRNTNMTRNLQPDNDWRFLRFL